jgi:hypothetical protein
MVLTGLDARIWLGTRIGLGALNGPVSVNEGLLSSLNNWGDGEYGDEITIGAPLTGPEETAG